WHDQSAGRPRAAALAARRGGGARTTDEQVWPQGSRIMSSFKTVGVIGGGAWGTALAQVCARAGLAVTLWAHETEVAEDIRTSRQNSAFLPGVILDDAIDATNELGDLAPWDLVLAVPPAQHMRRTLEA